MARRRRYSKRYYRKGRWSANIKQIINQEIQAPANSQFYGFIDLATNPAQSDTTVSQQYTVAHTQFSFTLDNFYSGNEAAIDSATAFIMYIPQGYTITSAIVSQHPEWIMSMRFYGKIIADSNSRDIKPLSISTRVKRRLQTGDKIVFFLTGNNTATGGQTIQVNGILRWWTKAN